MNATILCVGSLKEKWQKEACEQYLTRLKRYGKYSILELPDEPEPAGGGEKLSEAVIEKEGRAILKKLKPDDLVIALCVEAKQLSSEELAENVRRWELSSRHVVFVIGGSLGLSKQVTDRADVRLSFSRLTFPHLLMRVILLEQIYRAEKINAGERYHK